MLKFLLVLTFLSFPSFSQEGLDGEMDEESYKQKILQEFGGPKEKGELDQVIEETTESLANMGGMNAQGQELAQEDPQETAQEAPAIEDTPKEPVKIQESFLSGVMNEAAKSFVGQFLAENPFSRVPKEQLKTLLVSRFAGQPLGSALENNPKFLDMSVDLIRDKRALPSLVGLVNKPEKVKTYGYVVIGIFVLVFILNLMNSKGNIFRRILRKLTIGLVAFVANIGAAFFIFREELGPTLDIVFQYYHL